MSGGVDSAISAYLLKELGYDVSGVFFIMQQEKTHCQKQVEAIAHFLDIPLVAKDISADFSSEVIEYFVGAYGRNVTPNPCVICNQKIKFRHLIALADEMGIWQVATGHYATVSQSTNGERAVYQLSKAKDVHKDQSYFLYRLSQDQLKRVLFPLSGLTKIQVKATARRLAMPIPDGESQDVCFFSAGENAREFLSSRIDALEGLIVDEDKKTLGQHSGLAYYTIGQRFGLKLSGGPYYVIKKEPASNTLIVSKNRQHQRLLANSITIKDANWTSQPPVIGKAYNFCTRYQGEETTGRFVPAEGAESWKVILDQAQWSVAEGQSLVAYDGDVVIGGGIIIAAENGQ